MEFMQVYVGKERPKPPMSLSWAAPESGVISTHSVSGASRTSSQKSHGSRQEVFARPTSLCVSVCIWCSHKSCYFQFIALTTALYNSPLLRDEEYLRHCIYLCAPDMNTGRRPHCTKCPGCCLLAALSSLYRSSAWVTDLLITANSLHLISRATHKPWEQWEKTSAHVNSISACVFCLADDTVAHLWII